MTVKPPSKTRHHRSGGKPKRVRRSKEKDGKIKTEKPLPTWRDVKKEVFRGGSS
jgi:hypothetical protein